MVERQLPKLHTGVRFPSPAILPHKTEVNRECSHNSSAAKSEQVRRDSLTSTMSRKLLTFTKFLRKDEASSFALTKTAATGQLYDTIFMRLASKREDQKK